MNDDLLTELSKLTQTIRESNEQKNRDQQAQEKSDSIMETMIIKLGNLNSLLQENNALLDQNNKLRIYEAQRAMALEQQNKPVEKQEIEQVEEKEIAPVQQESPFDEEKTTAFR